MIFLLYGMTLLAEKLWMETVDGNLHETLSFQKVMFKKKTKSPLFNKVGQLRTSSHLQLRPGQDKA